MGKVHSKHGSCFVVNAHFNPVCQIDEGVRKKTSIEIINEDGLGCSELSLSSSCEEKSYLKERTGFADDKYPLQVALPPDTKEALKQETMEEKDEKREKAEEEKSEKEQRLRFKEMTCDLSIENLEEFSFKLYNFNGHGKVTKDDITSLVRSIYGVVGKTVKLSPSGSKAIKVRVAISPERESDDEDGTRESSTTQTSPVREKQGQEQSTCIVNNPSISSVNSINTATTYLSTTNCDSPRQPRCFNHPIPSTAGHASPGIKCNPVASSSPSTRGKRGRRATSLHRPDFQEWQVDCAEKPCAEPQSENRHPHCDPTPDGPRPRHKHKHQNRDHLPESRDRRSHYLGLAGVESHLPTYSMDACGEVYSPPYANTCPYRIIDRTHVCGKTRRQREAPDHHCSKSKASAHAHHHHRSRSHDIEPHPLCSSHYYASVDPADNLLGVDVAHGGDFVPEDKFDWEHHHHRRSKSYDVYDTTALQGNLPSSPKPKSRPSKAVNHPSPVDPIAAASPSHHQRHRHREKNHQRTMQQVANWIEYGHRATSSGAKREEMLSHLASPAAARKSRMTVERHEHHHVHEHIHHHYHHYVDS